MIRTGLRSRSNDPVQVCRVCFTSDGYLYPLVTHQNLYNAYETITGLSLHNEEHLPMFLCPECAQQLLQCTRIQSRTLQAHFLLLELARKHDHITLDLIKTAARTPHSSTELLKVKDETALARELSENKDLCDVKKTVSFNCIKVEVDLNKAPRGKFSIPGYSEETPHNFNFEVVNVSSPGTNLTAVTEDAEDDTIQEEFDDSNIVDIVTIEKHNEVDQVCFKKEAEDDLVNRSSCSQGNTAGNVTQIDGVAQDRADSLQVTAVKEELFTDEEMEDNKGSIDYSPDARDAVRGLRNNAKQDGKKQKLLHRKPLDGSTNDKLTRYW